MNADCPAVDTHRAVAERPPRAPGSLGTATIMDALRPMQWLHFTVLPCACFDRALPLLQSLPALGRGFVLGATVLGWGYLLNAISDRDLDHSVSKNPFVRDHGPSRLHYALAVLMPCFASMLAASASSLVLVATLTSVVSGTMYSVGPRLKGHPIICTVLNVGCFAPLMLMGLAGEAVSPAQWALVATFSALLLQNQLLHEAADAKEDRDGGLQTTFGLLGPRGVVLATAVAGAGVLAASWFLAQRAAVPTWLVAHAIPYVVVVPWLLWRCRADDARVAELRAYHRLASAVSGALLFVAVI
ncbi:UbiA family prenyltransferase [Paraliomyxa miuraensis]|uniref:UbiA family prenyltransferase n=1 Tax=Paraliomyxa miuraensis TaxID=376150 RepID=UPI00224E6EED|nr:UbiA family prenyltransferase [Paraliomyxa miuraensis]MCX4243657.1 UbiA family prenyltransferase [Paraliomyxa miuraensis]